MCTVKILSINLCEKKKTESQRKDKFWPSVMLLQSNAGLERFIYI